MWKNESLTQRHQLALRAALLVVTGHLLLILVLSFGSFAKPITAPRRIAIVQPKIAHAAPLTLQDKRSAQNTKSAVATIPPASPMPKPAASVTKPTPAPVAKQQPSPVTKTALKSVNTETPPKALGAAQTVSAAITSSSASNPTAERRTALVQQARSQLQQLAPPQQGATTAATHASLPSLATPALDGDISYRAASVQEMIVAQLKRTLTLPQYGTVTVALTIDAQGKATNLQFLEALNGANRLYVEKQLRALTFSLPEGSHTPLSLTLTLSSAKK